MKKRLFSILLMCCMALTLLPVAAFAEGETGVAINETNFPDANFRTVVKEYDTNKDENLSRLEIEAVKEIKCYYKDIRSLTGIEYFTALQTLECYSNQLTSLDISRNTALKSLDCAKNQLAALDVSQNTVLESLDCAKNQLATLDVSQNTALESLDCADNQLTTLDVSQNTALESLNCANNQLTTLDVSRNTALESLICAGNKLTALNVSGNATLKFLNCESNELTALDVNRNTALNTLNCLNNRLTSLNVSLNLNLQDLNCARNQLSALDVQKNTALKSLYCGYNQLAVLDVGQNGLLESLSCNNNLLTSLDVRQNTRLNLLLCFNNHLTSLDTSNQKWLHTLSCNNNNYPITITNDRNYDLSDLPGTFDVNKASNWSGGTVSGNILTVDHDKDSVTYTYDCGNGRTANFMLTCGKASYTVNFNTNGGSEVNSQTVPYGETAKTPAIPAKTGYTFAGWYLEGEKFNFNTPVTKDMTLTARWTANQYTITFDTDGGSAIEPITQDYGTAITAPADPTKSGYTFAGWTPEIPATMPAENLTVTAQWRYNGGGSSDHSYYTIKATAGAGGSISPVGNVSVREGRDQTFTITSDKGYAVADVKIDGKSIGAVKSYTFENVRKAHTIEVSFMKANGNPQTGVFVDVATGSYYKDAVDWAAENDITQGTDAAHFSPDGICTRAQAVTFLWRAAGSPKPETGTMPFTDVPVGSYYYDAVLWAVENGITKGISDTTFSPDATCSRAQIVTFLWRSGKSPAAGTVNPFTDVAANAYYADAVLWAVKEDITKGTTNTTFSPDADCTRAQIVTFLWRCKK